jgi:hypothetical protein
MARIQEDDKNKATMEAKRANAEEKRAMAEVIAEENKTDDGPNYYG